MTLENCWVINIKNNNKHKNLAWFTPFAYVHGTVSKKYFTITKMVTRL